MKKGKFKIVVIEKLNEILDLLDKNDGENYEFDNLPLNIPEGYFKNFTRRDFIFTTTEYKIFQVINDYIDNTKYVIFPKMRLNYLFSSKDMNISQKKKKHLLRTIDFVIAEKCSARAKMFITFGEDIIKQIEKEKKRKGKRNGEKKTINY